VNRFRFDAFGAVVEFGPRLAVFKAKGEHNVYEAMARQKRRVLAGDAAAIQRMVGAWKVANAGIQKRLEAVTAKIAAAQAAGLPVSPAWLYQQERWTEFQAEIQAQIDGYAKKAGQAALGMQKNGFLQGSKDAKELVATAGVQTGFKMLPTSAFDAMVGALTDKSPLHDLFAAMAPNAVQKAREIFAVGIAAGDHPTVIAKRFQDELTTTKQRSVLIARTESARAYTTAQKANYEANSDVVVASRWVSARDSRTCPLCWAKDGTIIPHGELVGFHPGCRCALAPVVKYLDVARKTGEEVLAEREANQPGYAKDVLGPARYELWKSGKIALKDVVQDVDHPRWGRGVRAKTLAQLQKEIEAGATGKALPSLKGMGGHVAGPLPEIDLNAANPLYLAKIAAQREALAAQKAAEAAALAAQKAEAEAKEAAALAEAQALAKAAQEALEAQAKADAAALAAHQEWEAAKAEAEKGTPSIWGVNQPAPLPKTKNEYLESSIQAMAAGVAPHQTPADLEAAANVLYPKAKAWDPDKHIAPKYAKHGVPTEAPTPLQAAQAAVPQPVDVLDLESLLAVAPHPNAKATATDYTKALIKSQAGTIEPQEVAILVKHFFPKSTASAASVLHHYAAQDLTPPGGFPDGFEYTPVKKAAPKAKTPVETTVHAQPEPIQTKPAPTVAETILGAKLATPNAKGFLYENQTGGKGGSNPGGFFLGADGVQRYVKFYGDPGQAYSEHLSNEVYRLLGLKVPTSTLFEHEGRIAYASELLPVEGTVGQKGLSQEVARAILDGFAADILTANWDAVGTGLDNVVLLKGGGVARIDGGGTFLYRAQGSPKPAHALDQIAEWEGFAPGGINHYYGSVFTKAGYDKAEDVPTLKAQVAAIQALRKKLRGWEAFVKASTPGLDPLKQQRIADMMEARTDLLAQKAAAIGKAPKPAKPVKVPKGGLDPKKVKPRQLSSEDGRKKRRELYGDVYKSFTTTEKAALSAYKGNSHYGAMNKFLRGGTKSITPERKGFIEQIRSMFRKSVGFDEDIQLYRGVGYEAWWSLQPGDEGTILTDHSFLSTANVEDISRHFATSYGLSGDPYHPVLLRIKAPRGLVAIPSNDPQGYDGEHEFILDHANYRVVKVTKEDVSGGRTLTILEVELLESKEGQTEWQRRIK